MKLIKPLLLMTPLLLLAPGCQSSTPPPTTHPVHGKVLVNNELLTDGAVEFQALAEPSWSALADIQSDGTFSLSTLHEGKRIAGALPGEYRVTIVFAARKEQDKRAPITLEKTYTVTAGENNFTIEVTAP